MNESTEILKNHKLKFPWTANDLSEMINSKRHLSLTLDRFINIFKSIGAIEEK